MAPVHSWHGDSVVYKVMPAYEGCRPALRKHAISPCATGSPRCTRSLWPAATTAPSAASTAPTGTPPAARLTRAWPSASVISLRSTWSASPKLMAVNRTWCPGRRRRNVA